MPPDLTDLAEILTDLWSRLDAGVREDHHAFRNAYVATACDDGTPALRTVVLRRADRARQTIDFHTDARSDKVSQLRGLPQVTWLFWDASDKVQARLHSTATLHTDDAVADEEWAKLSERTQSTYRTTRPPGDALDAMPRKPPTAGTGREHFMVVRCAVYGIDWLCLHPEGHRRAQFHDDRATWVAP